MKILENREHVMQGIRALKWCFVMICYDSCRVGFMGWRWALSCPAARQVCAKLSGARLHIDAWTTTGLTKREAEVTPVLHVLFVLCWPCFHFADVCGFASCMVWFGGAATLATMFGVHAGPGPAVIADHATMEIFRHAFLPWVGHIAQTQGFGTDRMT